MLQVDAKPLIKKLNEYCNQTLESAAGICISRTNYEVAIEHWLLKLLENTQSDIPLILQGEGIDVGRLLRALNQDVEEFKTGNSTKPVISPLLLDLIQDAWLIASVSLYDNKISSAALFIAFISRLNYYASGHYVDMLSQLSKDNLLAKLTQLTAGSIEQQFAQPSEAASGDKQAVKEGGALSRFCTDVTAKAKQGKIDAVFGRDEEIRQMIDILARRRKNNPIVVGEAGVGKTAVVEGLALRIAKGDVPEQLADVALLSLDLSLLEAGAGVKGEFENRLKGVISEIKAAANPVILFIDEIHTLVGSSSSGSSGDAANILKPVLARGELRTIGATTWSEYKKYFEKDPALSRRFQAVKLDEPDVETTILIMRGLKPYYEKAHGVTIRDDAIIAAAELSDRYITSRYLPDKAIDLLDTSGGRIKINLSSKPDVLDDLERKQQSLQREQAALRRDLDFGDKDNSARLEELATELADLAQQHQQLTQAWQEEKVLVHELLDNRQQLLATEDDKERSALRKTLAEKQKKLSDQQGDAPLVHYEVDPDLVAKVVSNWTGIPLGKVLRDEANSLAILEETLKARIKGQDAAIHGIAKTLKIAKSGLKDPSQPLGVFLLVGPSGVGKTETALTVADTLFGGEQNSVIINMSEFQEKHTLSRLIGSPPGYVGYGEGGVLTEAVRKKPYSVVLLDEVEKASLDVMNLFYQVFDKGVLADGEGREIDFKNTVIFLTSNLATDQITEYCEKHSSLDFEPLLKIIRPELSQYFKPALLARMNIMPFTILTPAALADITQAKLIKICTRLANNNQIQLLYSDEVIAKIAKMCVEVETGARNIDHVLRQEIMPLIADKILSNMVGEATESKLQIKLDKNGQFIVE